MTSLNPLDMVPTALQAKYLVKARDTFTAAQAPQSPVDPETALADIQADFTRDGGTSQQWSALKHCAVYPR